MFSATPAPTLPCTIRRGALVHAGAVITDMAVDLDRNARVHAHRQRVPSARVQHLPVRRVGVRAEIVQRLVQLAHARPAARSITRAKARCVTRIPPAVPLVDGRRLGFPHPRLLDAGQVDQRAVFGAERDVAIGLRHHRRLAGDRVAQHGEAGLGADDEGVEPVEVVQRSLQRAPRATARRAASRSGRRRRPPCRSRWRTRSPAAAAHAALRCDWTASRCAPGTGPGRWSRDARRRW